jgi:hypothetical protein
MPPEMLSDGIISKASQHCHCLITSLAHVLARLLVLWVGHVVSGPASCDSLMGFPYLIAFDISKDVNSKVNSVVSWRSCSSCRSAMMSVGLPP